MLSQRDIAHLSDRDLERLVVLMHPIATGDDPWARVALRFGVELIRVKRERRQAVLMLESDALYESGPGGFIGECNAQRDPKGGS